MKKRIFGFVIVLIAFSLLACSNEDIKVPTIPTPTPPEQVTPGTPVLPPETPITPPETPVLPPETSTPDVPVKPVNDPRPYKTLRDLIDTLGHSRFSLWFDSKPFISSEDAEAIAKGEKTPNSCWHYMYVEGALAVKISPDMLPMESSKYTYKTVDGELYITIPPPLSKPYPRLHTSLAIIEDGRILELVSDVSDPEFPKKTYTIYDSIDQMFGNTQ